LFATVERHLEDTLYLLEQACQVSPANYLLALDPSWLEATPSALQLDTHDIFIHKGITFDADAVSRFLCGLRICRSSPTTQAMHTGGVLLSPTCELLCELLLVWFFRGNGR
jgi:hypothetical protein